jgi:DNA-binding NarL/FixJ family response regulator
LLEWLAGRTPVASGRSQRLAANSHEANSAVSKGRKGRSADRIRQDRAEIAQLYLQGWTQADIGAKLGLSRQQIGHDLNAIRAEWLRSSLVDFNRSARSGRSWGCPGW